MPRTRRLIHSHLPRDEMASPDSEADLRAQFDTDDNADSMGEAYDTEGKTLRVGEYVYGQKALGC